MSAALLAGRGLGHGYAGRPVLARVDLALAAGELGVVVGPNGAGKTTLVRILSGVLGAETGTVELLGRPLASLSRREIARALAVIPQDFGVPFPFRVRELVAMGRAPHLGPLGRETEADRACVRACLERVGLSEFAEREFATLSGGEKQRVALARAYAQQTGLLLLDEPTAHMDLGHRLHAFENLRAFIAERPAERAVLVVTHDLVLAARFADSVWLLDGGRVAAEGRPETVLTPERIGEVYSVDAEVSHDSGGQLVIVARRSRIRYPASADESHR
ncbi:MAG: ABC transporter ATP-binding protein [Myxococcales bacterium]|nr:ABC transporter ATP-binding protein [Myxococcales bacterium]